MLDGLVSVIDFEIVACMLVQIVLLLAGLLVELSPEFAKHLLRVEKSCCVAIICHLVLIPLWLLLHQSFSIVRVQRIELWQALTIGLRNPVLAIVPANLWTLFFWSNVVLALSERSFPMNFVKIGMVLFRLLARPWRGVSVLEILGDFVVLIVIGNVACLLEVSPPVGLGSFDPGENFVDHFN